jgi:Protein kinase domain
VLALPLPLPGDGVVRLLAGVADALDAAHRVNLVHRDIKPSNLLVTDPGAPGEHVTLVDFGISRVLDADTELTHTGQIVGTIAYCAPEQLSRGPVEGAADQYALGGVAYECLTGQVPFPRESQLATMAAHLTAPPPRVRELRPDLPAELDAVLARALAKDPRDRYRTCVEFIAAFAAALTMAPRPSVPDASADPDVLTDPGVLADPDVLAALVASGYDQTGHDRARRAGRTGELNVRVGTTEAGVFVVDLARGPYAVRGEPADTAAFVRWLVAQIAVRHRDRDVCLVGALEPRPDERWLWFNWLPHARPSNPPVAGPHLATTLEAAADLLARLRDVVADRRAHPGPYPLVMAVLDGQLGISCDDSALAGAPGLGVHVVHLLGPADCAPAKMSTLDLAAGLTTLVHRRPNHPPVTAVPDHVPPTYTRTLGALHDLDR